MATESFPVIVQIKHSARKKTQNMINYFENLTINFNSYVGIKKPDMTDKTKFYKVYSPKKFKLRPRDDIDLDLKSNIQTPDRIELWLNLLPSLKTIGFHIENDDWKNNLTKDKTVQLHTLNRNFTYTIKTKKKQCIGFIFLLGERYNDIFTTKCNLI